MKDNLIEKVQKLNLEKHELEAILASFIDNFYAHDKERINKYLIDLQVRVERVRNL